jgi:hypothetical protein
MEWIMYKPRWGVLYNTSLEKHLHKLDVNTVVVCGCNFPNCPRTIIYEASERDFKIILAKDVKSIIYDIALQELKNIVVSLMNTNECIVWLAEGYLKFKIKEEEEDNIAVNYTFSEFNFYTVKRK